MTFKNPTEDETRKVTGDTVIDVGTPIYNSPIERNHITNRETSTGHEEEELETRASGEKGYFFIKIIYEEMKKSGKQPKKVLNNLEEFLNCYEEHNKA